MAVLGLGLTSGFVGDSFEGDGFVGEGFEGEILVADGFEGDILEVDGFEAFGFGIPGLSPASFFSSFSIRYSSYLKSNVSIFSKSLSYPDSSCETFLVGLGFSWGRGARGGVAFGFAGSSLKELDFVSGPKI